ncbi:hypothetical protein EV382_1108 [Micromonospora violae]|uniref:Uncharacterized protein n=1 Tax=Micromonospora violae TaxID=1278207 RepID=A0A4Q7UEX7_9ACTN|nr:hypothetical protein [Micromonospora violae]RZT77933.1 hypothetical protein EV382_1108 [Micromonospora violae]
MQILRWQYTDEQENADVRLHRLRRRCEQIVAELEVALPVGAQTVAATQETTTPHQRTGDARR